MRHSGRHCGHHHTHPRSGESYRNSPYAVLLTLGQGKVDVLSELNKLEKKTALAHSNRDKLAKQMSIPGYETAVKEHVRAGNIQKVSDQCPA